MSCRALWLPLFLLLLGCGVNLTPKKVDEPCTRTGQCEVGLVCLAGVCQPIADGGVDGGADGGS